MNSTSDLDHLQPLGSSQGGLAQYNERTVLQAIRLHGPVACVEIARLTRLTAQAVSLITKRLLDAGLIAKGQPQRGKVGQPSVPLSLDPDGAFAIGVHVGRRSMDMLVVDFVGQARHRWTLDYAYPDPQQVLGEIALRLKELRRKLPPEQRTRVQGIGIAAPLSLGGWQQLLAVDDQVAEKWQHIALREEVARLTGMPVELIKDTAAACVAELVAGRGRSVKNFLYAFVDTFIGGGLVLDSHLHSGISGNAGAIGSLPLWVASDARAARPAQLLSLASLITLERRYAAALLDTSAVADERALQPPWLAHTQLWLAEAGAAIAHAVNSAACLLDLDGVIVDGSFSRALLDALLGSIDAALARYPLEGVATPKLLAGTIGSDARALGGAWLPLYANFAPDRDLFLKTAA